MVKAAAVVTGDGGELQSLIDGMFFGEIPGFELAHIVAGNERSPVRIRAARARIPVSVIDPRLFPNTAVYTRALTATLSDIDADTVILVNVDPEPAEELYRAFAGRCLVLRSSGEGGKLAVTVSIADADGTEARRLERIVSPAEGETAELLTRAVKRFMKEYHG